MIDNVIDCIYNYTIDIPVNFEWDPNKEQINIAKHKVDFAEASSSFNDPEALYIVDLSHSEDEERLIHIGISSKLRILTVVYCVRKETTVRIISARKATKNEQEKYEQRNTEL